MGSKTVSHVFISMLLLPAILGALLITSVAAPAVIITPIGEVIMVPSNETFTLAFKMRFDKPDVGFFYIIFYWDNNESLPDASKWNFTFEGLAAKFTDGTPFSVPINVTIEKRVPTGYPPGYYRYVIRILETYGEPPYGEPHNGDFWVNVTIRAAGLLNGSYIPHADGDQNITISSIRVAEDVIIRGPTGLCTIHVGPAPPPPPPPPPPGPIIIDTPINDTIYVVSGGTFVLLFNMKFNETEEGGFFVTFYWDNNEADPNARYWNFTYEGFVAKFVDGTEFSVPINVAIEKRVPDGYPSGYYRYRITISGAYGELYNGGFWVNVTMRAAGVMNGVYYPHAEGDQNITIFSVYCKELNSAFASGICTINVIPPPAPVGGIVIPVDKLTLLAPLIALTISLTVAAIWVGILRKYID